MPELQLLFNGSYHVLVTAAGGGFSRWNGLAITRWREDASRDPWGSFCYLRDVASAAVWSTTARPVPRRAERHELNLADVAEVWRRGSVIGSWLLDLTAGALLKNPQLEAFDGRVSDSGEGRWTIQAAIDEAVPTPVLSAALHERFASRGEAGFANQLLPALRHAFGGRLEKPAEHTR